MSQSARALPHLLLLLIWPLAACQTELDIESQQYACGGDEDCAKGLRCLPRSADDPRTVCRAPEAVGCDPACLAGQECIQGECQCTPQRGDCDGDASNGCEADLLREPHCGRCDNTCADGTCTDGACACGSQQCAAGISCCDDVCVDVQADANHCGACGAPCDGACVDGVCTCAVGQPDFCPGRCANLARDRTQCGDCNTDCTTLDHTRDQTCADGVCAYACEAGFGDCDLNAANGCETGVDTLQNCGACRNDCSTLPRVFTSACVDATCQVLVCVPGAHNCDNLGENGCEPDETCRLTDGLVALYTFTEGTGNTVADLAAGSAPVDLTIEDASGAAFTWLTDRNGLRIDSATRLSHAAPPRLASLSVASGLTVEAWVKPATATQNGPARIIGYSSDPSNRNFALAQDGEAIVVRLRTTDPAVNANGMFVDPAGGPDIEPIHYAHSWSSTQPTHLVATFDEADGALRLYVDGVEAATATLGGTLGNWDASYALLVANELMEDRSWLGELYLLALYDRALAPDEVTRHYVFGSRMGPP